MLIPQGGRPLPPRGPFKPAPSGCKWQHRDSVPHKHARHGAPHHTCVHHWDKEAYSCTGCVEKRPSLRTLATFLPLTGLPKAKALGPKPAVFSAAPPGEVLGEISEGDINEDGIQ